MMSARGSATIGSIFSVLSYGTRAALVYLRQHPDRVRTVTLMGVAPTYLKMPLYHAQAAARAMDLLLQECERMRTVTRRSRKFARTGRTCSRN